MDVAPDIDSLELSVRAALAGKNGVRIERNDDEIDILGAFSGQSIAYAQIYEGRPKLATEHWHGHFDSAELLATTLVMILGGLARQVEEFKGDHLSATLLMNYDGDAWYITNTAFYINPDRPDLWQLETGESWSWVFTTWKMFDASEEFRRLYPEGVLDRRGMPPGIALGAKRIDRDKPHIQTSEVGFAWYEKRYGQPVSGMRWSDDKTGRFVYQVPSHWEHGSMQGDEIFDAYKDPSRDIFIVIRTWLRESAGRDDEFIATEPVKNYSLESHEQSYTDADGERDETTWVITFTNGQEDMGAWYTLRRRSDEIGDDLILLKAKIEEGLKAACLVPHNP